MFSSLSIGNTNLDRQFQSVFGQGECKMEIRKLDPNNPEDALFALMTMGDDRNIHATYIFGQKAYVQNQVANS
jgi:guanine deaminase